MSTANTLRNMALIFMISQDGFEMGELEKEFTDIYVVVKNQNYFMEAKSVYKRNTKKSAESNDLGAAMAQINKRAEEDDIGVIVTNQTYINHEKEVIDKFSLIKISNNEIKTFIKSPGFINKIKGYKRLSDFEKKSIKSKRLKKYLILSIDGRTDEDIRNETVAYLSKLFFEKGVDFEARILGTIISTADQILDTLSEKPNSQLKYFAFKEWFNIRKNKVPVELKYENNAVDLFGDEEKFNKAITNANSSSSIVELTSNDYYIINWSNKNQFVEFLEKNSESMSEERSDVLKINWLLIEKERCL